MATPGEELIDDLQDRLKDVIEALDEELERIDKKIDGGLEEWEEAHPEEFLINADLELKVVYIEQKKLAALYANKKALLQLLVSLLILEAKLKAAEAAYQKKLAEIEAERAAADAAAAGGRADADKAAAEQRADAAKVAADAIADAEQAIATAEAALDAANKKGQAAIDAADAKAAAGQAAANAKAGAAQAAAGRIADAKRRAADAEKAAADAKARLEARKEIVIQIEAAIQSLGQTAVSVNEARLMKEELEKEISEAENELEPTPTTGGTGSKGSITTVPLDP